MHRGGIISQIPLRPETADSCLAFIKSAQMSNSVKAGGFPLGASLQILIFLAGKAAEVTLAFAIAELF